VSFHLDLPFFSELDRAHTVLLAGAGGGADVFAGLPLYFALKAAGKDVHLASLSFATIFDSTARVLGPALVQVDASTETGARYFPEVHLSRWFETRGEQVPVYCFDRTGARPIAAAYRQVAELVRPDAVVLVDGGTDSLMRGDEAGLGTPEEDVASIAAAHALDVPLKLLACIGFGIDAFHGVCHAQVLEAVAALDRDGGYLGAWSLMRQMPGAERYREAVRYAFGGAYRQPSVVNASILSALDGAFGDHHATERTRGSELFINPLMTLYWGFRLEAVARRNLYLDRIAHTETNFELRLAIERFRESLAQVRPWMPLPM
jgi:hypothetical protein